VTLEGRGGLVIGASRGIGAATARAFGKAGAAVVLASRGRPDSHDQSRAANHRPRAFARRPLGTTASASNSKTA
jgi:NAD(P)-dependent dehydrogenase (short-subunit alcohol dehydrogenase family)